MDTEREPRNVEVEEANLETALRTAEDYARMSAIPLRQRILEDLGVVVCLSSTLMLGWTAATTYSENPKAAGFAALAALLTLPLTGAIIYQIRESRRTARMADSLRGVIEALQKRDQK